MKILIVTATPLEIRPLLDQLILSEVMNDHLTCYSYQDASIHFLITGIGMVQTAYYTTRQLALDHYDFAINAGICGSYHTGIQVGKVVHVREEIISEMGATNNKDFYSVFQLGLVDPDEYPYHDGKLINDVTINSVCMMKLPQVRGCTVNRINSNEENILRMLERFKPDVESMEGAAFLYSCLMEKVPCLEIRAVSNYVRELDRSNWNVQLALKNLNKTLLKILEDVIEGE
ncbi:MAG: futalosine hydrolase [Bacteroidota bacterium]|nr:futalosine hydrolase [Bacteroidota bacterium]